MSVYNKKRLGFIHLINYGSGTMLYSVRKRSTLKLLYGHVVYTVEFIEERRRIVTYRLLANLIIIVSGFRLFSRPEFIKKRDFLLSILFSRSIFRPKFNRKASLHVEVLSPV